METNEQFVERRNMDLRRVTEDVIRLQTKVEMLEREQTAHKGHTERQFEKLEGKIDTMHALLSKQLKELSEQVVNNRIGMGKVFAVAAAFTSFGALAVSLVVKLI